MDVDYVVSSAFNVAVLLGGMALGIFNFPGVVGGIIGGQIFILLWQKRLLSKEDQ